MKILSNIKLPFINLEHEIISIDIPTSIKPFEFLKKTALELSEFETSNGRNSCIFLSVTVAGRREIKKAPEANSEKSTIYLADGRRIRVYYAACKAKRVQINYGWYKVKKLSTIEKKFVEENWCDNFFLTNGRFLAKEIGGVLFPDYLIYRIFNQAHFLSS